MVDLSHWSLKPPPARPVSSSDDLNNCTIEMTRRWSPGGRCEGRAVCPHCPSSERALSIEPLNTGACHVQRWRGEASAQRPRGRAGSDSREAAPMEVEHDASKSA